MQDKFPQRIRSFVMRSGHITQSQRTTRERLLPTWGLTFRKEAIDFQEVFGRAGSSVLEIGFGMGETTALIARQHPEWNILAVDVYRPGVGALLAKIEQDQLANIRIVEWDAVEVLEHMLTENNLDAVHIYFPDPWPKKRHHKRRLIQAPFIELLVSRLRAGGLIHLATDWPEYADQMLAVCSAQPHLKNQVASGFAPKPAWRPQTKFEARGLRLGHPVADLLFQKI
jgi:tRNA (guanine-N7-)-methyltransferase